MLPDEATGMASLIAKQKERIQALEALLHDMETTDITIAIQEREAARMALAAAEKKIRGIQQQLHAKSQAFDRLEVQLATIQEIKDGTIRIKDTGSVLLHSPTYCAFCGQMFPDTEKSTEQIRAHVTDCTRHPLNIRLREVKRENRRLEQRAEKAEAELARLRGGISRGEKE